VKDEIEEDAAARDAAMKSVAEGTGECAGIHFDVAKSYNHNFNTIKR